ncbi:16785_t:CDS:2, partial [Racocetra persica]
FDRYGYHFHVRIYVTKLLPKPMEIGTAVAEPSTTSPEQPIDKPEPINDDKKSIQLSPSVLNIEKKHLPWDGKEVEIIVLDSDSEKDDDMTIEKGNKVLTEVVSTRDPDSDAASKVNNDNNMVLDCDDEYIYIYDDDDEHAYLDQQQQEEQRILEVESDELFLKDDPQDLMQDIQSAIFYWHWDEDVKKKLPMAPLINDDFTLYLQLQNAISRSTLSPEAVEKLKRELPPIPEGKLDARESWDNYFKFRKEYAINKRMAQRQRYEKNYIGDSDDDELTYASGKTAEVIEQRKERMALEQGYSRRYAEQEKLADPKDGVIINLGHLENEDNIYIPDSLSKKLKPHQ